MYSTDEPQPRLVLSVGPSPPTQYERQSEKREVEDLMEQVDSQWKELHDTVTKPAVSTLQK